MTDAGPEGSKAAKAPKPVRQSKRAHLFAIIGLIILAASGPLGIAGMLSPMVAMLANTIAAVLLIIAFIIALRALLGNRKNNVLESTLTTWIVLVVSFGVVMGMINQMRPSGPTAAIHDISTNVENPPAFVDIVALREADGAPNPPEYNYDESAALTLETYPDLQTIIIEEEQRAVFARATEAAEQMGWEVVAAVQPEGRIEAVAVTPFVGFRDDVVIRVISIGDNATAVDIRSKSRIGKGDMGANAKRIRAWQDKLLSQ